MFCALSLFVCILFAKTIQTVYLWYFLVDDEHRQNAELRKPTIYIYLTSKIFGMLQCARHSVSTQLHKIEMGLIYCSLKLKMNSDNGKPQFRNHFSGLMHVQTDTMAKTHRFIFIHKIFHICGSIAAHATLNVRFNMHSLNYHIQYDPI